MGVMRRRRCVSRHMKIVPSGRLYIHEHKYSQQKTSIMDWGKPIQHKGISRISIIFAARKQSMCTHGEGGASILRGASVQIVGEASRPVRVRLIRKAGLRDECVPVTVKAAASCHNIVCAALLQAPVHLLRHFRKRNVQLAEEAR